MFKKTSIFESGFPKRHRYLRAMFSRESSGINRESIGNHRNSIGNQYVEALRPTKKYISVVPLDKNIQKKTLT